MADRTHLLQGVVTAASPLRVRLYGATSDIPANAVAGYSPTIGDTVLVLAGLGKQVYVLAIGESSPVAVTGFIPIADTAGIEDDTTYDNSVTGSGKMRTVIIPTTDHSGNGPVLAVAKQGDAHPRLVITSDLGAGGFYFGDGTYDPVADEKIRLFFERFGVPVDWVVQNADDGGATELRLGVEAGRTGNHAFAYIAGSDGRGALLLNGAVVVGSYSGDPNGHVAYGHTGDLFIDSSTPTVWIAIDNSATYMPLLGIVPRAAEFGPGPILATPAHLGHLVEIDDTSPIDYQVEPGICPVQGGTIELCQVDTGHVTITAGSGVTVHFPGGRNKIAEQWGTVTLYHRFSDDWVAAGDLTT